MTKFHLTGVALLCLISTHISALEFHNILSLKPLTGSGACAPFITCPPDITIDSGITNINVVGLPSTSLPSRECGTPSVSFIDDTEIRLCNTEITRLWTASSLNPITGNPDVSQCRQNIVITPLCNLICPANACVDIADDTSPNILGQPTVSLSSCDLIQLDFEDIRSNCIDAERINRVWTGYFSGQGDCPSTCIQNIIIGDNTAPTITDCPENVTVNSTCDNVNWNEPFAFDNCRNTTLTANFTSGSSDFEVGSTIVTYSAFDLCGNASSCEFVVSVLTDGTHPECPDDINVEANDINPIEVTWDVPTYNGTCTECPEGRHIDGYNLIGSINGSNYYVSRTTFYYEDATRAANRLGGHVASITSEEENNFIADNINSHSVYIGLTDEDREGKFMWDSGESLSYENWFYNQPNNHNNNQDFVQMMPTGLWNDIENKKLCYVLEVPCENVRQVGGPTLGNPLFPGTYTISYIIEDGCGLSQCCSFDVNISNKDHRVNSQDIGGNIDRERVLDSDDDYKLYPNPVSDYLTVELRDFEEIKYIGIVTIDGRLLSGTNEINAINKISIENLTSGIHLVAIHYHRGAIKYEKIIKI